MKSVLEEFNTTKMKAADMVSMVSNHYNFKHEKTTLEHARDITVSSFVLPKT